MRVRSDDCELRVIFDDVEETSGKIGGFCTEVVENSCREILLNVLFGCGGVFVS